jgi:pantoate--beta-alanine ligase
MRGMKVTRDIGSTRLAIAAARRAGRRIGLVPTMGYLHRGHVSLIDAARRDQTWVVVSIFVNPTQFGPSEDFDRYPRDSAGDLKQCEDAGVELVFMPSVEDMYPPGSTTTVHVAKLTDTLCGPCRPGHFDGVATVVAKLFNIVQPDAAYFGQKDAQQLAVLRRMTRDLDLPIEIVGCPTERESDGLAMSSRNALLSPDERRRAIVLYQALSAARTAVTGGERDARLITAQMRRIVEAAEPSRIDYISIVDPETMQPIEQIERPMLVALAVRIGNTRLIDNLLLDPAAPGA